MVIYGSGVNCAPNRLDYGAVQYQVVNVFLGDQDGEAALERVRTLLAASLPLTPEDRLDLVFAPLMRHQQPAVAVVREALGLAVQLPEDDQRLEAVHDVATLRDLLRLTVTASSLEEVADHVARQG